MLIKNIETIRDIVQTTASVDWDALKSSIEDAENEFIIPVIGQELYDELDLEYNKISPDLSVEQLLALKKIQKPLAYFSMMLWMPEGMIKVNGDGIHVSVNENLKTAWGTLTDKLEFKYLNSGFKAIDSLLEFLELHAGDYEAWTESSAYTVFKSSFIKDAKLFTSIYSIGNSRRVFIRIKPEMVKVEDFFIKPNLGIAYFNELKSAILSDNLSIDDKITLDYIQKAVAYFTAGKSLENGLVEVGPDGIFINSFTDGVRSKQQAQDRRIQNAAIQAMQDGHAYIRQMKTFLNKNASNIRYQTYKTGEAYTDPAKSISFPNTKDNSVYVAR